ncbi:MAG: amidase family protein [Microthrixaceae bacterium]
MADARILRPDDLGALVPGFDGIEPVTEGPLSGIEAVVKDCFAVEGHTSSNGSERWLETHGPATLNSRVISELLSGGASIVGMGRLDQIAFSLVGDTPVGGAPLNPRHPELFCGGSSAGCASAVAGGRASLGIGTDTAGSVRVPAALCGLHGLRPTWGSIDLTGCIPLAPSFDTAGILAANPLVLRRALRALSKLPPPESLITRVVVDPSLSADPQGLVRTAQRVATQTGASLEEVDLAHLVNPDVAALHNRLQGREVWGCRGNWATTNMEALDEDIAYRLRACAEFAAEDSETVDVNRRDRQAFTELLAEVNDDRALLVKPILGRPLPKLESTPDARRSFRRSTIELAAAAGLAGWPELTWTSAEARRDPSSAVGLLTRPGNDELLVDVLERLWANEGAERPASDVSGEPRHLPAVQPPWGPNT